MRQFRRSPIRRCGRASRRVRVLHRGADDATAASNSSSVDDGTGSFYEPKERRVAASAGRAPDLVIDVAAGKGRLARQLVRHHGVPRVVCVDPNPRPDYDDRNDNDKNDDHDDRNGDGAEKASDRVDRRAVERSAGEGSPRALVDPLLVFLFFRLFSGACLLVAFIVLFSRLFFGAVLLITLIVLFPGVFFGVVFSLVVAIVVIAFSKGREGIGKRLGGAVKALRERARRAGRREVVVLLVGLHPDEATEAIVDAALLYRRHHFRSSSGSGKNGGGGTSTDTVPAVVSTSGARGKGVKGGGRRPQREWEHWR